jgi:hypothetical protein
MAWLYWAHIRVAMWTPYRRPPFGPLPKPKSDGPSTLGNARPSQVFDLARSLRHQGNYRDAIKIYEQYLGMDQRGQDESAASMYGLAQAYLALDDMASAREWTDRFYAEAGARDGARVEPAYYLCRGLRERGRNALAYYYYLQAKDLPVTSTASTVNPYIPVEPDIYDHLLDYEKSILWSYVGNISERHSKLHGLAFSMKLLEKSSLPQHLRASIFSNLQYYTPPLRGMMSVLRAEKAIDEEWRYSTPTFLDNETTLIRVVNYYVAEDGSYHVSPNVGDQVKTQLVVANTDEAFEVKLAPEFQSGAAAAGLLHPDAYVLGLEDTRVVRDLGRNNSFYTLSASAEYSQDGHVMNQVLGVLDLTEMTHTVQNVIKGPYANRHDKNWVFAGGLDNVVYGWYPSIEVGSIDPTDPTLRIHTTIPSPLSFDGMRGSTNGVMYKDDWWFVTHAVIYRPGQMRKYLHRLVVLNSNLTAIVRHSLPFTFEETSDVEYCLGFKIDDSGLSFGYSVRDRSSRVVHMGWEKIGGFF